MPEERLQKILSQAGIASRRKAEELIQAGRVTVNGAVITELGSKADLERDHIKVDSKLLRAPKRHIYIALNKPKGCVTTVSDPEGRPTVMHLLRGVKERVFPVGRLDYNSEGLLLLTNDGEFAHRITAPASHMIKTYVVKVNGHADRGTGEAVPGRHFAARQENRARPAQADQARSQSLVRGAPRRGPPESDPHHVQAFRQAGGEASAREDRISGAGSAARAATGCSRRARSSGFAN